MVRIEGGQEKGWERILSQGLLERNEESGVILTLKQQKPLIFRSK